MVSTDCLQIMKVDESYYVSPLIQKRFIRLIRVGHFIWHQWVRQAKQQFKE